MPDVEVGSEMRTISGCLLFFIVALAQFAYGGQGIIGDAVLVPPEYYTFASPPVGEFYSDPIFGTKIKRITNSGKAYTPNGEISYFNVDGSYFIATDDNAGWILDGHTGEKIKKLGKGSFRAWWCRWSMQSKYHFHKYEGNEIRLYDFRDMSYELIHKFDEYESIGPAGGEGDISDDGRYWCLDGDGKELFVYDLIDRVKYPVSSIPFGEIGGKSKDDIDYATVSPSGKYVIVFWVDRGYERYKGSELYDRNWNFIRQLLPWSMHSEMAYDDEGEEILVTKGAFRFPEICRKCNFSPGDCIAVRLSDGSITLLLKAGYWTYTQFSTCAGVNRKYVYAALETRGQDPTVRWWPYWGEIIEIPTDGSQRIRRLAHHRSRTLDGSGHRFKYQPDLWVNRQGDKIIFKSNYGTEYSDLYIFDLESHEQ